MIDKGLLEGMKLSGRGIPQALDGRDGFTVARRRKEPARKNGFAVHDDRAASAGAVVAGKFGARKTEGFTERFQKRLGGGDVTCPFADMELMELPIDRETDAARLGLGRTETV